MAVNARKLGLLMGTVKYDPTTLCTLCSIIRHDHPVGVGEAAVMPRGWMTTSANEYYLAWLKSASLTRRVIDPVEP